jgi:hypothetical protein|tara:strand:- start:106 stop:771 length:666 start_codon:yes stop_codon:yes gene_type:complete
MVLPQTLLLKLTVVRDVDKKVFVLPIVPNYYERLLTVPNTTQSPGAGLWIGANRHTLQDFVYQTKKKRKRNQLTNILTKSFKGKYSRKLAQQLIVHPNLIDHVERCIIQECNNWYMQCRETSSTEDIHAILAEALDEHLLSKVQQRAAVLDMTHLTWTNNSDKNKKGIISFFFEKLMGTFTTKSNDDAMPINPDTKSSKVEMDDPRVGLVVAFQRMHLFDQ